MTCSAPPPLPPPNPPPLPPSNPPPSRPPGYTVTLEDPAELASAVPALLGFHPTDSLVLVATGGPGGQRLGLTLRTDLPPPTADGSELDALTLAVLDGLLRDGPRGAAVLVFTAPDRGPSGGPAGRSVGGVLPHRRLVDRVVDGLTGHEVDVHTVVWAEHTGPGARWACYPPCVCTGLLPDGAAGPLAVVGVLEGRVVRPSRSALQRSLAPADPTRIRRREALLRARDRSGEPLDLAPERPQDAVRLIDAAIADAGDGRLVLTDDSADDRVLALAGALAAPVVRDAALARCLGQDADAAEQLWSALLRETPDPEAAEPAALLAVSALVRGDGGLANIALDRAERAWPGHRLTGLLRSLATIGLRPDEVRRVLRGCAVPDLAPGAVPGVDAGVDPGGAGEVAGRIRRAGGSARSARRRRPSC